MDPNWTGPYKIHEVLSKGTVRLSRVSGTLMQQKINISRLKLYYSRDQDQHSSPQLEEDDQPADHETSSQSKKGTPFQLEEDDQPADHETSSQSKKGTPFQLEEDDQPADHETPSRLYHEHSVLQQMSARDLVSKVSSIASVVRDIKDGQVSLIASCSLKFCIL